MQKLRWKKETRKKIKVFLCMEHAVVSKVAGDKAGNMNKEGTTSSVTSVLGSEV